MSPQPEGDIERVGEFLATYRELQIDEALSETIKLLVLDTLGCAVLAAYLGPTERLIAALTASESPGPARLWLHDAQLSAANAAMVNATAVHGFELDDITSSLGHYGSVTVPVALALAEAGRPLSGAELIQSVVAGIETGLRVNACVGAFPHLTMGFHGPSIFGTFASAATASTVLGLSPVEAVDALCHAAQFTAGLMGAQYGGMGKRLLPGRAAHSGIVAAQIAAQGFTSTPRTFDGGYGSFPEVFSGGNETYDLALLSQGLGSEFKSRAVNFKMWACRIPIHPSLEAIRNMRRETPFTADEVALVEVKLPDGAFKSVGQPYQPDTPASAQLNLQYCVAVMLTDDDVFEAQFTEARIRDPHLLATVPKVAVSHDPALDGEAADQITPEALVEVTLHDGRRLSARGEQRGIREPIGRDGVISKFRRMCAENLPGDRQDELVEQCLVLDELPDATVLSSLLTPIR